jgi:predicted phosphoadenosine phosphosulfate sulfurtransferase
VAHSSRIYLGRNVFEAALERMRFVFREFDNVYVSVSGGKDSTVVLNLALIVAQEMGRLPVRVLFLDQEAEWDTVITHVRSVMDDPRVQPYWLQIPFRIFNATSPHEPWLWCWKPNTEWIRPKEPDAITTNDLGTDRFHDIFGAFLKSRHPRERAAYVAGVRAEESPSRRLALTTVETYKGETWGTVLKGHDHYTFYPVYDWSYTDVWKAIHDHGWPYCKLYDYMYQYGTPVREMRVSNVNHETAVKSLYYLREIEPQTWNRITSRLAGTNTAMQMKSDAFNAPKELPFMFSDWREYRDYLLEHLVTNPDWRKKMRARFDRDELTFLPRVHQAMLQCHITTILTNDWELTHCGGFYTAHLNDRNLDNITLRSSRWKVNAA